MGWSKAGEYGAAVGVRFMDLGYSSWRVCGGVFWSLMDQIARSLRFEGLMSNS